MTRLFSKTMATLTILSSLVVLSCDTSVTDKKSSSNKTTIETPNQMDEPATPEINNNCEPHVVIYGIGIQGKDIDSTSDTVKGDKDNKFIIIYNQCNEEKNISNWQLKKAAYNTESDSQNFTLVIKIPENTTLQSKQFLLLTGKDYKATAWQGDTKPDITKDTTLGLAKTGNHLQLLNSEEKEIDRLDFIKKGKTQTEPKYKEIYISENTAYIYRTNQAIDTDDCSTDFTTLTIEDSCALKNSQTQGENYKTSYTIL